VLTVVFAVVLGGSAHGQEASEEDMKQANNPLASFTTLNFHNYYISELDETDGTANTFWIRYAQPFKVFKGNWLLRASLPVNRVPTPEGMETGLGPANAFAAYLFKMRNPDVTLGAGPLVALPTSTGDIPGGETWDLGAALVLFDARSSLFQWGGLVTYQTDVAGDGVNSLTAVQPFGLVQMGAGWYLRSTGVWVFNIETDNWTVPFGMGVGKVVKAGKNVINAFIEPQFTILSSGDHGQPQIQVFFGVNFQSIK
jgi:hypothetical protein